MGSCHFFAGIGLLGGSKPGRRGQREQIGELVLGETQVCDKPCEMSHVEHLADH